MTSIHASEAEPGAEAIEAALRHRLGSLPSVLVALSGGVDSSVLAAIAAAELKDRAVAATGVSPSLQHGELALVEALCTQLGIEHVRVATHELEVQGYVANAPSRCYFCKQELYSRLGKVAKGRDLAVIVDGTTAEDLLGHRPGKKAADEAGVISPWVELGATKAVVRAIAGRLGLPTARRPSSPCLSSRIAYGVPVSSERLERIGRAEAYLHSLGLRKVRVRLHDAIARIEVPTSELHLVAARAQEIGPKLRSFGFVYVTLDLHGLRSGSLLEVLQEPGGDSD